MKRHIRTYTVNSNKEAEFLAAAEDFVEQTIEQEAGVIECSITRGSTSNSFIF